MKTFKFLCIKMADKDLCVSELNAVDISEIERTDKQDYGRTDNCTAWVPYLGQVLWK